MSIISPTSVIVPAYIVDMEVLRLAQRMFASLGPVDQLIIVENGSDACRCSNQLGTYIHKREAIGYARAANIGLALADCERVVVTNVDIEFPPNWLAVLNAEYDREGPGVLSPDDAGRTGVWEESWYSCWLSDKKTLAQVGYFDETLPYTYHDQDMSIRMAKKRFAVKRTGAVQVKHQESSTRRKMNVDDRSEQDIMLGRYGCLHFREWRRDGGGM